MPVAPPPHVGIHHVALYGSEIDKALHFYRDLLGYTLEWQPDADNVYLTCGLDNLALHRGQDPTGCQRLHHMGMVVTELDHVYAWESFLKAHGVNVMQATRRHRDGSTSCYVRDPLGTVVQILFHPRLSGQFKVPNHASSS